MAILERPQLVGDTLTFAAAQDAPSSLPNPLTLSAVQRVDVRGSAAGTGAAIGAGIGLTAGLAVGLGIAESLCDDGFSRCTNRGGGVGLIAVGGMAGGALIGALIGAANTKWTTIYPAHVLE
jgi:hypothetical protein